MIFTFVQPWALLMLALLPAVIWAFRHGDRRRRQALARFAVRPSVVLDRNRRRLKRALVLTAFASLIVAASGPMQVNRTPRHIANAGDIVFLLDVSRSMLSTDVGQSRLERARLLIRQLTDHLHGERVALVAFAGTSAVQCPLTADYAYFAESLRQISSDAVTRGGTEIGSAIRFATTTAFDDLYRDHRTLVILTDGGDGDGDPQAAAREASRMGIRLIVIGIGSERTSAVVPTSATDSTPFLYQGEVVRTRLESSALKAIAAANRNGMYLNAGSGNLDTETIYPEVFAKSERPASDLANDRSIPKIILCLVIALLTIECFISERPRKSPRLHGAISLLIMFISSTDGFAQQVKDMVRSGNEAYRNAHYTDVELFFSQAAQARPDSPEIQLNWGIVLCKLKRYDAASAAFIRAHKNAPGRPIEVKIRLAQANLAFQTALTAPPTEAIDQLRGAMLIYRDVLELDASSGDAKYNIEVVKAHIARLKHNRRLATERSKPSPRNENERRAPVDPAEIIRQSKISKPLNSQTQGRLVDRDW